MTRSPDRILLAEMSRTRHEGPARSALHLMAHMDPARCAFFPVFSFPENELAPGDLPPGVTAHYVPMPRPTWQASPAGLARFGAQVLAASGALARLVREHGIHVVHANSVVNLHAVLAAQRARRPLVVSVREVLPARRANRAVVRWVCGAAVVVHAVSGAVRDALVLNGADPDKIRVIPNGVSIPDVAEKQIGDLRAELGLPADAPVAAIVGTVTELKGHHVLLQAMREVLASLPDARLLVVGGAQDDSRAYLEQLMRDASAAPLAGHVIFTGPRDDVPALLAMCDVHVQPSVRPDSLPRTVLEAMAAGTPTVGARIGGIPEMVLHDQTGLLVPPGDAAALARELARALGDPDLRGALGRAARDRARREYSPEAHALKIMNLYDIALKKDKI